MNWRNLAKKLTGGDMKLSEAIAAYTTASYSLSPKTRTLYTQILATFPQTLLDSAIDEVTVAELREWVNEVRRRKNNRGQPISVETVRCYIRAAKAFFNWLVAEQLLEISPAQRLKLPPKPKRPPKNISDADLERLLDAAFRNSPRDYALILFIADTACRVGGAAGLRLADLDLENQKAIVSEKGRGGQNKARLVRFGERTTQALRAWLVVRPRHTSEHVFVGRNGRPLSSNGITQIFKRLGKKGGCEGQHNPHSLRHAWPRRALQNGLDLGAVSQIMGHSSINVTHEFYSFWDEGDLAHRHKLGQVRHENHQE